MSCNWTTSENVTYSFKIMCISTYIQIVSEVCLSITNFVSQLFSKAMRQNIEQKTWGCGYNWRAQDQNGLTFQYSFNYTAPCTGSITEHVSRLEIHNRKNISLGTWSLYGLLIRHILGHHTGKCHAKSYRNTFITVGSQLGTHHTI